MSVIPLPKAAVPPTFALRFRLRASVAALAEAGAAAPMRLVRLAGEMRTRLRDRRAGRAYRAQCRGGDGSVW
ncbi:MAG: hypothetical protein ACKVPY_17690 [Paracoccaceae bacterium]